MNRRKFLSLAVGVLFTSLFLAFGWIYFYGLTSNSGKTSTLEDKEIDALFQGVAVGRAVLKRFKNEPVWVLNLSSKQISQTQQLDQFVIDPGTGCELNKVYCILVATTNRDGVYLQYTLKEPPQLLVGTPWYGGFVDPASGQIYDLIGRSYQQNKQQSKQQQKGLLPASMKKINTN